MFKYLMLLVMIAGFTSGCKNSRDGEKKAYAAGCAAGINVVIEGMGAQPNQDKISAYCSKQAEEYLKNSK